MRSDYSNCVSSRAVRDCMSNDSPIFAVPSSTNFARVNVQGADVSVQYDDVA